MFKTIDYCDIDTKKIKDNYLLIDVRSPGEYETETIPGAINIPILDNQERELVGTIYKQESVEKAKQTGIDLVSKRLPNIYNQVSRLNQQYGSLIFFCSRGGFRSSSLVSLFASIGTNVIKLNNGYKGYRKHINESLPLIVQEIQFIVLYGNTGTGKTDILKELARRDMDVLDLEGCAHHRGSILGGVGLGAQNSQKMFESLIYVALAKRKSNIVFVEGESRRIGKDILPEYLYKSIHSGIGLYIESDMEYRIDNILKEYVHDTDGEIINSLEHLRKHLGDIRINNYIESVEKHKYEEVIRDLMIKYYDPMYAHNNRKYKGNFFNDDPGITAQRIIAWAKENLD